ncbi:MAG: hypothetical protein MZV65_18820 [Chromatiales bacterium]|nr:hypothetical protein [Chromatiales bacterium]
MQNGLNEAGLRWLGYVARGIGLGVLLTEAGRTAESAWDGEDLDAIRQEAVFGLQGQLVRMNHKVDVKLFVSLEHFDQPNQSGIRHPQENPMSDGEAVFGLAGSTSVME